MKKLESSCHKVAEIQFWSLSTRAWALSHMTALMAGETILTDILNTMQALLK